MLNSVTWVYVRVITNHRGRVDPILVTTFSPVFHVGRSIAKVQTVARCAKSTKAMAQEFGADFRSENIRCSVV